MLFDSLKQYIIPILIFNAAFLSPFITAMESTIQGVPKEICENKSQQVFENNVEELTQTEEVKSAAQKKKKKNKNKNKKKKKDQPQNLETEITESFDLEKYWSEFESYIDQEKSLEKKLSKLQWFANLVLFYAEHIKALIHVYQMNSDFLLFEKEFGNRSSFNSLSELSISSDEGLALVLQVGIPCLERSSKSSYEAEYSNIEKLCACSDRDVQLLGRYIQCKMLLAQIEYCISVYFNYFWNLKDAKIIFSEEDPLGLYLIDSQDPCDEAIYNFAKKMPGFMKVMFDEIQEWKNHQIKVSDSLHEQINIDIASIRQIYNKCYQKMKIIIDFTKRKIQYMPFFKRNNLFALESNPRTMSNSDKQFTFFYPSQLPVSLDKKDAGALVEEKKTGAFTSSDSENKPKKSQKAKAKKKTLKKTVKKLSANMQSLAIDDTASSKFEEVTTFSEISITEPSFDKYDVRVHPWFIDAFTATQSYESVEYHSVTRLVDHYLFSIGLVKKQPNKTRATTDTVYELAGQITYPDHSSKLVVFHATKGADGLCYHRGYTPKANCGELFQEYFENNFWKVIHRDEFPPLGATEKGFEIVQSHEKASVISEDDLCVKINDPRLNIKITLFKPAIIH